MYVCIHTIYNIHTFYIYILYYLDIYIYIQLWGTAMWKFDMWPKWWNCGNQLEIKWIADDI